MSLLRELSKVLYKTGACRLFLIKKYGYKLRFNPTKISRRLWVDSFEKRGVYQLVDRFFLFYLKPSYVVVDVGANIGYYTLLSAEKVGPSGKVYAFEAHPKIYKYLEENIHLNHFDNVETFPVALGGQVGSVRFSDQSKDDMNNVTDAGEITVHMDALDNKMKSVSRVNLLKIDVEGYEKFVLSGSSETLGKTDTIFFEAWDKHFSKYGYKLQDIFSILSPYGFSYFLNDEAGYKEIGVDYIPDRCVDIIATKLPNLFV